MFDFCTFLRITIFIVINGEEVWDPGYFCRVGLADASLGYSARMGWFGLELKT